MAVAFDSANSSTVSSSNSGSHSHTMGAGAAGLVFVFIAWRGATSPASYSVTFGGQAMSLVDSNEAVNTRGVRVFSLANPPTGAQTVSASWTNNVNAVIGSVSFTGAGTPSATTKANDTSNTITVDQASAVGEIVADFAIINFTAGDGTPAAGASQTQRVRTLSTNVYGLSSTEPGAASVTMSWNTSNRQWHTISLSIPSAPADTYTPSIRAF